MKVPENVLALQTFVGGLLELNKAPRQDYRFEVFEEDGQLFLDLFQMVIVDDEAVPEGIDLYPMTDEGAQEFAFFVAEELANI